MPASALSAPNSFRLLRRKALQVLPDPGVKPVKQGTLLGCHLVRRNVGKSHLTLRYRLDSSFGPI